MTCANPLCGHSLEGKRRGAIFCSRGCSRTAFRLARRRQRTYEHPRCVICNGPMVWPDRGVFSGPNRTLRSSTCSRKCSYTRINWLRAA